METTQTNIINQLNKIDDNGIDIIVLDNKQFQQLLQEGSEKTRTVLDINIVDTSFNTMRYMCIDLDYLDFSNFSNELIRIRNLIIDKIPDIQQRPLLVKLSFIDERNDLYFCFPFLELVILLN